MSEPREISDKPLRIIGDAAIATESMVQGRLVPVLLIDCSERPDVQELIRLHEDRLQGSAGSQWGSRMDGHNNILLHIEFSMPLKASFYIEFQVPGQAALVELIMISKCVYLQHAVPGERFVHDIYRNRILIEVPHNGFEEIWPRMYRNIIEEDLKRRGLAKDQAQPTAAEFVARWDKFGKLRVPQWYERH
jgi:hypothetical protein